VRIFQHHTSVDDRGSFREVWRNDVLRNAGIEQDFVQDNFSTSVAGVLRGLHFQYDRPQGKLVTVLAGRILDVAVDLRPDSPRFAQWTSVELSADAANQFWVPPGFAHGFYVYEDAAVLYKCTDYYVPELDAAVRWNDPAIGAEWPSSTPILSQKDASAPPLAELQMHRLLSCEH
ncbi:MAG TPA: dTDP-4-dehydrorhamnose 3,5-epimerase, partial [Longimicrobiales bacterium]